MMKPRKDSIIMVLQMFIMAATFFFTLCDARHPKIPQSPIRKNLQAKVDEPLDIQSYGELSYGGVSSLSDKPPFDQSLPPVSSPENSLPLWGYLPLTPMSSPATAPSPHSHLLPPPQAPKLPLLGPPPRPLPKYLPSPPANGFLSPPPKLIPSPPKLVPSPLLHPPPVAYPPPSTAPSPHKWPSFGVWCVAKPTVPDPIVQQAMDYACGSGADCKSIQPNGPCFQPNTLFAHASYAFNSYWQQSKVAGGTCDFGGTAMLVTTDPSFDNCQFVYN